MAPINLRTAILIAYRSFIKALPKICAVVLTDLVKHCYIYRALFYFSMLILVARRLIGGAILVV